MSAKLEADRPWALFYRDGKTLDEVVSECGGTIHDYSPWLTMPLTRAAADAAQDTHERRMKRINELEAEVEKAGREHRRLLRLGGEWIRERQKFRARLIKALGQPWPPTPGTEPLNEDEIVAQVTALNISPAKTVIEGES